MIEYLIFAICLIGSNAITWRISAGQTIDFLVAEGYLILEEDDEKDPD